MQSGKKSGKKKEFCLLAESDRPSKCKNDVCIYIYVHTKTLHHIYGENCSNILFCDNLFDALYKMTMIALCLSTVSCLECRVTFSSEIKANPLMSAEG